MLVAAVTPRLAILCAKAGAFTTLAMAALYWRSSAAGVPAGANTAVEHHLLEARDAGLGIGRHLGQPRDPLGPVDREQAQLAALDVG